MQDDKENKDVFDDEILDDELELDEFDDLELDDFSELDDLSDDLDEWDEDMGDLDAEDVESDELEVGVADAPKAKKPKKEKKKKAPKAPKDPTAKKSKSIGNLIVVGGVAVIGGGAYFALSGGMGGNTPNNIVAPVQEQASTSVDVADADMPPMPMGLAPEDSVDDLPPLNLEDDNSLPSLEDDNSDLVASDSSELELEDNDLTPIPDISAENELPSLDDALVDNEMDSLDDEVETLSLQDEVENNVPDLSDQDALDAFINADDSAPKEDDAPLEVSDVAVDDELMPVDMVAPVEEDLQISNQQLEHAQSEVSKLSDTVQSLEKQVNSLEAELQAANMRAEKAEQKLASSQKASKPAKVIKAEPVQKSSSTVTSVQTAKPKVAKVPNWVLRSAQPGMAVISDQKSGDMRSIEVGDTIAGLGTIEFIGLDAGIWIVRGSKSSLTP